MSWSEVKKINSDLSLPLNKAIGEIYDGNGDRCYPEYNIEKKKLNISSPFESQRSSVVVYNGEIHILGGAGASTSHYAWNGTQWRRVSTLPYDYYSGSAVVYNGEIHILGGASASTSHYAWNGTQWRRVSTIPYSYKDVLNSAVVYNNQIHILGSSSQQTNHYVWDGTQWQSSTSLPNGFYRAPAVVYNNKIYCIGGPEYSGIQVYNGTSWTAYASSTIGVSFYSYQCAVVYDDYIYVIGGSSTPTRIYLSDNPSTTWVSYVLVDVIGNLFLYDTQNNKKVAFDKGRIKSVQRGTSSISTSAVPIALSYVDPDKTFVVIDGGAYLVALSENSMSLQMPSGTVTNSWQVIEFN